MQRKAFSMLEVMIALVITAVAFLPIYNLFRFGSQGAVNNIHEVTASNYAADLINFVRDIRAHQIETVAGSSNKITLSSDEQIAAFFSKIGLTAPPPVEKPFIRRLELEKFKGNDVSGIAGISGWLKDLIFNRKAVPNYLICVKVAFPRMNSSEKDDVTLLSMAMD
ncbi:MAG: hypothetical protein CVV41_05240 [Candidatus Riflebacteria bacterium HGW-Riflebacteria-1]|jgi:prepilin-type N-terminal cleavage/methylation domain-containing protein|nr:MAG: hypothetical protein CVV41_05240 [Candidatus Riflebacteria bacterium HGW-Riflebacteria-1]